MFNQQFKEKFMNETAKSNMPKLKRIFELTSTMEIMLDKDLFDFNLEELAKIFFSFDLKSINQVNEKFRLIRGYISYAILQGEKQNNINSLSLLSKEWKNQFLDNITE